MSDDKPQDPLSRTLKAERLRSTIQERSISPSSGIPAVNPDSDPAPPSYPPNGDRELAEAINALANEAASSIKSSERLEKAAKIRDWTVAGLVVVATIANVAVGLAVRSSQSAEATRFQQRIVAWEERERRADARDRATEKRSYRLEAALKTAIDINRSLSKSVGALMESESVRDPAKKRQLRASASVSAIEAQGKAVKAEIDQAKVEGKPPPPKAVKELKTLKEKAAKKAADSGL